MAVVAAAAADDPRNPVPASSNVRSSTDGRLSPWIDDYVAAAYALVADDDEAAVGGAAADDVVVADVTAAAAAVVAADVTAAAAAAVAPFAAESHTLVAAAAADAGMCSGYLPSTAAAAVAAAHSCRQVEVGIGIAAAVGARRPCCDHRNQRREDEGSSNVVRLRAERQVR